MAIDNMLYDGKTKASPANLPGARLVNPVKPLGKTWQVFFCNLIAKIAYGDNHLIIALGRNMDDNR